MRKWIFRFLLLIVFLLIVYVPKDTLFRDDIWKMDHPPIPIISDEQAESIFAKLDSEIHRVEALGKYQVSTAYAFDEKVHYLQYATDFPVVTRHDKFGFLLFGDEAEYARPVNNKTWTYRRYSDDLKKRLGWSEAEYSDLEALKVRDEYSRRFWHPEMKRYPQGRHLYHIINNRLHLGLCLVCGLLLWKLSRVRWVLRKLFNKRALQTACYFVTLCLSVFVQPAVAQQIIGKLKKKNKKEEQPISGQNSLPASISALRPKTTLRLDIFGDATHDRQQFVSLTLPVSDRFDVAVFNQNRQAVKDGPKLSLLAAGIGTRLSKQVRLTAIAGPQYSPNKDRVDQVTAFLNLSFETRTLQATIINRLSWGVDGETLFADRHVTIVRADPMPQWLAVESEIRRSKGGVNENFLGPVFKIGQKIPTGRLKKLFGGLYFYPHFDFVKDNWDVRVGLTYNFAW